jgi:uncharacterized membrane protein YfcA
MHIDPYIVLGSAVVGLLVGMTGAGGGALMTPMLILLCGLTSAGAGSLMIVLLLFVYPSISAKQLVGTDMTQAVP